MQRIPVDERSNWRERAEQSGFVFHTVNGERYWDESAYYAFSLKEVEDDLEAATAALDAMCGELVAVRSPMIGSCSASPFQNRSGISSRGAGSAVTAAST